MLLYEAVLTDASDPVFNPAWRQGSFVAPFPARLGCPPALLPAALLAHLCAAGLFLLAASWHWAFWDLDVFLARARVLALHFARIFGIHLALAGSACFLFGSYHLERVGVWTSDAFGGFGAARPLVASFSPAGAALLDYSAQVAHHLAAGAVLAAVGAWHSSSWPGVRLGAAIAAFSLEGLLASSICPFFFSGAAACGLMWYGSSLTPNDLYGPTRFSWDASFFEQEILFRAAAASWAALGESLLLADYVGVNPAKGGLFRAGPMIKGDGVVQAWAGHTLFSAAAGPLSVRRMPAFFETFPVLLVDARGVVRAAIPFRRAEARSSPALRLSFAGGIFAGSSARAAPLVKNFARKAQLGEVLCFGAAVLSPADGVLRSALRGWFTYAHAALVLLFWFGHLWHAGRAVLRDAWTGLAGVGSEYGLAEKIAS
jgi:photosystem II CP47 chlorophyll apoprotein